MRWCCYVWHCNLYKYRRYCCPRRCWARLTVQLSRTLLQFLAFEVTDVCSIAVSYQWCYCFVCHCSLQYIAHCVRILLQPPSYFANNLFPATLPQPLAMVTVVCGSAVSKLWCLCCLGCRSLKRVMLRCLRYCSFQRPCFKAYSGSAVCAAAVFSSW